MRLFFSFVPGKSLTFFLDDGQGLLPGQELPGLAVDVQSAKIPRSLALPENIPLLSVRAATVEDYPPNHLAVNCAKCKRRVLRETGYKRISENGFLCEACQYGAGLPLRASAAVEVGGGQKL